MLVSMQKLGRVKKIKYLDNLICWMSAAFEFVSVHILTVYIEPQNQGKAESVMENLNHILALIFERVP
jgi:hypothetical protein